MSTQLDLVPVKPTTAIVGEPTKKRGAVEVVPAAGQRPRRRRRRRRPGLGLPHRHLRPDARRRPRHPDRPRQLQPGAVHPGARLGQRARHRPARPQHAGPADRRVPHHPVRGDPRGGDLRGRRLGDRHVGRLLPRLARDRRHARRRRDHELPVAAARGRRALRVLPQRREHRAGAGDHPHSRSTCAPPAPSPPNCRAGCSSTPPARSAPARAPSSGGTSCRSCCRRC